jgi:hypothetical protein
MSGSNNQNLLEDSVGQGRLFGIFINTTLYRQITESIGTYTADLESDGWHVVLYTTEGGKDYIEPDPKKWTTEDFICELEAAERLRELLKNEYDQGMVGCIFIGELPAVWYKGIVDGVEKIWAVDHYFRDIDSDWYDTNGDGQVDENIYTDGDYHPEIWMSRLYVSSLDGDEVELMENYFRKNHAYRIGDLTLPKRALDYVDDDFAGAGFFLRGLYDEITQVNDNQITTKSDYEERLTEGYDLIRVTVHGSGPQHAFYNTPDFATAYAHCYVHSPIAQDVQLRLGGDDSIGAWLNGIAICEFCRGHTDDKAVLEEDAVNVSLDEGWNRLMLKIGDLYSYWRFSARFTNNQGGDIVNLGYNLNNPEVYSQEAPFIRSWLINGFYYDPNTLWSDRLDNDHLGGESDVNAVEGQIDGDYAWKRIDSYTSYIDLNTAYSKSDIVDFGISYAFVNVYSPVTQMVELWLGSDDGIKIWLNGELVGTFNEQRGWLSDQNKIEVILQSGWNRLLIKVSDYNYGHGLSARFAHSNGTAVEGLEYDPIPVAAQYIRNWLINGWYKNPDRGKCLSPIDYLDGEVLVTPSEGELDGDYIWKSYYSNNNDINLNGIFSSPATWIGYQDVLDIDPCCFFYDSYSCDTFHWWYKNYICGGYVFSHSYGLASWGPCDYGSTGVFYDVLDLGNCLGEAQFVHLTHLVTNNSYRGGDYGNFGMFGDPTLTLRQFPKSPTIIYVDGNAEGNNSGTSWGNAYNYLQDALSTASWGTDIHVAQGTYWPDLGDAVSLDDRTATFKLKNGVVIKGGYAGVKEPVPNVRDISLYDTILRGDIGIHDVNSDNSYHVVNSNRVGPAAVLDGFTITGGYADANDSDVNDCGGGIYVSYSTPNIIDCNIIDNYAKYGGGMYNAGCNLILENCTFGNNSSVYGGGMYNYGGQPILNSCEYHTNSATQGGGIYSIYCKPSITNCMIRNNSAVSFGGGLYNAASNSIINNCTISGNSAGWDGGAGICNNSCRPYLTNCIVWDNRPQQILDYYSGPAQINYSDIEGGWPIGLRNINIDPEFADPNNGDYHLKSKAGRWNPIDKIWEIDEFDSPCIDMGDPNMSVGDELEPNGDRINMGAYGGTSEASKSL